MYVFHASVICVLKIYVLYAAVLENYRLHSSLGRYFCYDQRMLRREEKSSFFYFCWEVTPYVLWEIVLHKEYLIQGILTGKSENKNFSSLIKTIKSFVKIMWNIREQNKKYVHIYWTIDNVDRRFQKKCVKLASRTSKRIKCFSGRLLNSDLIGYGDQFCWYKTSLLEELHRWKRHEVASVQQ